MSTKIYLDQASGIPPYEQLRSQINALISAGALKAGDRLPTVRALAADLGIAQGTVTRAYRELEISGAVVSRRRTGTVVADGADHGAPNGDMRERAEALVRSARSAGMDDDSVLSLVRGALLTGPQVAFR